MEEKLLRDAQYRKGASIAYFNSLNSAITLVTATAPKTLSMEKKLAMIEEIKLAFLDKYKDYYATTVAQIGAPYSATDTIIKVRATKTQEELRKLYREMSEDERKDGDIRKVVDERLAELKKNDTAQNAPKESGVATG
jgi:multidrug efflux pump subunit AcrB